MLQLVAEGDRVAAGDGGKVFAKIGREIQCDLLRLLGITVTEVVNAHHGVADEMRPHLQHRDVLALVDQLALLSYDALRVILEDQAEHRHRAQGDTEEKEQSGIDERMDKQRDRQRQQIDEHRDKMLSGQLFAPADQACQIEDQHGCHREKHKHIIRRADVLIIRRDIVENVGELRDDQQNELYAEQDQISTHQRAGFHALIAAMQQEERRHQHQQRGKNVFKKSNDLFQRRHINVGIDDRVDEESNNAQKNKRKKGEKIPSVPTVYRRHENGERHAERRHHQHGSAHGEADGFDPAGHASTPPSQNGKRSFCSCSRTPSVVMGFSIKPLAPVLHASRA